MMDWSAEAASEIRKKKVRSPLVTLPLHLVSLFGYPAEAFSLLFDQPLMFTPYALNAVGQNSNFVHDKLTALTGYRPQSIRDSIHEEVEFYLNTYKPRLSKKAK
jgi:dihydroflavonol-4-reductase